MLLTPFLFYLFLDKVKLSMCLINYVPHNEDVWGSGSVVPSFLDSSLNRYDMSVSRSCHFTHLAKEHAVRTV
jgi:hypothetical protein